MSAPRTLRSWRFLLLFATVLAILVITVVETVDTTVHGRLPDDSWSRLFWVVLILIALLGAVVLCAATLRSRVIMKDGGVELVWPFRRYRFGWQEISEITINTGFRYWQVHVRSAEREHLAFMYPVWPLGGAAEAESKRHHAPPPHTPRGLTKLVSELQDTWSRQRDPSREQSSDQSFSTGA
jgi:PH (Pleckstrin Homology) domain-containing protein